MTSPSVLKRLGRLVDQKSVYILTGLAVTGVIATGVLAVEATPKALKLIEEENARTTKEKIGAAWKCYVPAAMVGVTTIGSIISIVTITNRRSAVLASLYSMLQGGFIEYKDKVIETIGKNKEQKIRDELVYDQIQKDPPTHSNVIITGSGDVLCYDRLSGRYFSSDIEKIRKVVNDLNEELLTEMFIPLNEFYFEIGLPAIELGNSMGFNLDDGLILVNYSSHLTPESKPCLALNYEVSPKS